MKNRNVNIAFLALFQLLIFVAPLTIKAGHRHEPDPVSSFHVFSCKTVSKEVRCLICSFEFVTYNIPNLSAYFYFQRACKIELIVSVEEVFHPLLSYFSLRAPPQF
jgi:hypothetical protein